MESLNQLLEYGKRAAPEGTEYIFDDSMPAIYSDDDFLGDDKFSGIFARLFNEARNYFSGKCRVTTSLDDGVQHVYIDHNGSASEERLAELNGHLEKIAEGETWSGSRSGNRMAAERLRKYGGKLHLEVLTNDPTYHVRTDVTIPVPE